MNRIMMSLLLAAGITAGAAHAQEQTPELIAIQQAMARKLDEIAGATGAMSTRLDQLAAVALKAEQERQAAVAEAERLRAELDEAHQIIATQRADAAAAMIDARKNLALLDQIIASRNAASAGDR